MTLGSTIRCLVLCAAMLVWGQVSFAQIRLIPKSRLDSVANPRVVGEGKMAFKQGVTVDFGRLGEDAEPWQQVVEWQNRDTKPIVITHIKSSCSCLRSEVERRSVGAGKSDKFRITYYPKGHPGAVNQRLFIYTNLSADQPTAILNVRGVVTPSADHRADYGFHRGALLMRQDTIYAERGKAIVVRIACMNSSDKQLRLTADTLLSSRGVKMWTEPNVLAAGAEGDMVISVGADASPMPQGFKGRGLTDFAKRAPNGSAAVQKSQQAEELNLYIKGLSLPPRDSRVVIRYKEQK